MPLDHDLIVELQSRPVIPDGEVPGTYLTRLRATSEYEAADDDEGDELGWTSGPDPQVMTWHGDPNGLLFAQRGTLATDLDTPALYQNTDSQSAWQLAGTSSLLTDSYYEFIDDGSTTGQLQTAGDVANLWDDTGLSAFNQGTDISLVSGVVTVNTTGVYSIQATWEPKADTAADAYNYARGRFTLERTNEPGSPSHDQVFLDDVKFPAVDNDNKHIASFAVGVTAFMFAGDTVVCESRFESTVTAGSTWSINTASMYIERLA